MGIACWDYDLTTQDLWWSENAGPLFGRPAGFIPSGLEDAEQLFVPEETRPQSIESMLEILQDGPNEAERQARLPDDSLRWTGHRYFLMTDEEGNATRLAGMMMDIDGRKRRDEENEALLRTGQILAESLDVADTTAAIARVLVPDLADWCVVDLLTDGELTPVAIAHVDAEKARWANSIRAEYPTDPDAPAGVANVIRTGESEFYPDISDEMLQAAARDDRHLEILSSVGFRSAIIVPLRSGGKVIGAATLAMADSKRRFDQESLEFARRLAPQIAASIDNARLYDQLGQALDNERHAVQMMQEGLTPGPLPDLDGIVVADHYQIGGSEVGGDWYDLFETGQGAIAIVIGDVVGRGVQAVASMSQFRNALRALLGEGHTPPDALTLLHRMTVTDRGFERGFASSAACLTYQPASRRLVWSAAGHPPAMLRYADGSVERLWKRPDAPLGAGTGSYGQDHRILSRDCLLVLYTDGLIERRDESLNISLDRLETELASAPEEPKDVINHLLDRLPSNPSVDDVAVLALHFS
jgi:serine phosphatase RsbU (regulator of sigma subunit)